MRKLIIQQYITIDSFAADSDGGLGFMEKQGVNKTLEKFQKKLMQSVDLIILGRKTYEMFAGYWPNISAEEQPMAKPINSTPWLVFSHTLTQAPRGTLSPAAISKNDPVDEIKRLKHGNGKDMIIWGSLSLTTQLLENKCVDELNLIIYPSIMGRGKKLFPDSGITDQLQLLGSKDFEGRAVMLRYGL